MTAKRRKDAPYLPPPKPRASMRDAVAARRERFRSIIARTTSSRAELDAVIRTGRPIDATDVLELGDGDHVFLLSPSDESCQLCGSLEADPIHAVP